MADNRPSGTTGYVQAFAHLRELDKRRAHAGNDFDTCLGAVLQAADQAGTSIVGYSRDLRHTFANESYAELLGKPIELIVGYSMPTVMGDAAFQVIRPYVERVLARERVEYEEEIPIAGVGWRRVHAVYIPGFDLEGTVWGWAAALVLVRRRDRGPGASRPCLALDAAGFRGVAVSQTGLASHSVDAG